MTTTDQALTIHRADDRGRTQLGWLDSRHAFSFGRFYDPDRTGYRALRVINDDRVAPAAGFGEHPHDNMEILTWVLDGALKHGDSLDNAQTLRPGELQAMSAGTGIVHSEFNASDTDPVHFLQVWIEPSRRDIEPRYQQQAFDPEARRNRWDTLASGADHPTALPIEQDATLSVADLDAGQSMTAQVGGDRHAYLHVATGGVTLDGRSLSAGDAATWAGGAALTLSASEPSQLLLFDLA